MSARKSGEAKSWWAIPWIISTRTPFASIFTTAEISAFRFRYMKWMIPLTLLYPTALLFVTGHGYFATYLPDSWTLFLATHNVTSHQAMLWWMTAANALKALGCALAMLRQKHTTAMPTPLLR